jgi:hypothetical protein
MSAVAEHTVVVYSKDAYRFSEIRAQYEEYVYIQCLQADLIALGILGFFVKTAEEEPGDPIQIFNNPNVLSGSPLSMVLH